PPPRCRINEGIESETAQNRNPNRQNTASAPALSCKNLYFPTPTKPASSTACRFFTGDHLPSQGHTGWRANEIVIRLSSLRLKRALVPVTESAQAPSGGMLF